ncbi:MAG: hypothetical protein B6D62_01005 [Candidatus Cloacimonas sp. 4484_275]|nr:MAG: hypothetical protein B6D62_01005 [Candidatus Cloacimonas sp. 4484_275]RLC52839.1 MAG: hypothetical protein DRZ79_00525 [Candidatus Cloacimonadota bacterium]
MNQQLELLIKMQKCDDIIGEKEKLKKKLPEELNSLKENLKKAVQEVEESKKLLEENLKAQNLKEMDIRENKDKIAKYKNQLLTIKTNKEYKALNSEISHLEAENSQIDDELIELMEEESQLRKQLKEREEVKKTAEDNLKANEDKLNKKIESVTAEIEKVREERNSYAKNLPRSIIKRYAALIKHKNRKAVVFNENNACSGCGFQIRPQLVIEINEGNRIISCENCGRILVAKPKTD